MIAWDCLRRHAGVNRKGPPWKSTGKGNVETHASRCRVRGEHRARRGLVYDAAAGTLLPAGLTAETTMVLPTKSGHEK
jgi:hypothetical protein